MKRSSMIQVQNEVPLKNYTTLGVGGNAKYFSIAHSTDQVVELIAFAKANNIPFLVLGEGSNLVISSKGFDGLVIKLSIDYVNLLKESESTVNIEVGGGYNWDNLVQFTIEKGWWGMENMSLIPRTVGACPVQNVGAYGQECKNIIASVTAYDTYSEEFISFNNESCKFGFRESIFNTSGKDRYIITSVEFVLSKKPRPCLVRPEIRKGIRAIKSNNLQLSIRELVIKYRTSGRSLPNNPNIGSAGTFYRTTVVNFRKYLQTSFRSTFKVGPKIGLIILIFGWKYRSRQGYRMPSRMLIDACGLKHLSYGDVKLYHSNSAVLITDKNASPQTEDIIRITKELRREVFRKTGFCVPIEPTLVGFSDEELKDIFQM